MKWINYSETSIIQAITIVFFVFVSMALLLIFMFNNARKKIENQENYS
jgi:cbb3-type cytochrome oxidase subunit 3